MEIEVTQAFTENFQNLSIYRILENREKTTWC